MLQDIHCCLGEMVSQASLFDTLGGENELEREQ